VRRGFPSGHLSNQHFSSFFLAMSRLCCHPGRTKLRPRRAATGARIGATPSTRDAHRRVRKKRVMMRTRLGPLRTRSDKMAMDQQVPRMDKRALAF
jgi:hypothetical protein